MAIKQGLTYNHGTDRVEGFEDFGSVGQTRYIANHTTMFMVRGLASKWKQPIGYFFEFWPNEIIHISYTDKNVHRKS